ncbi:hypothetical protein [Sphingopyxis alaskensis]|uniref:hypothetical protein n=1 Tax=Sphingopyxis alaskensis TaxID=117207 RepID=UPI00391C0A56
MSFDTRLCAVLALAATVGACTPTDATFGNAVRTTMAAQVVDPDPRYDNPVPTTDGAKSAGAVDRYRADRVKQPDTISTTDGQSGSPK